MTQKFTRWDPVDHLKSDEDMALYLDACLDEDPGDGTVVRAALNDIARAQGMTELARATGITREGLHAFIQGLKIPEGEKQRLLAMTPWSYVGKAAELAKRI